MEKHINNQRCFGEPTPDELVLEFQYQVFYKSGQCQVRYDNLDDILTYLQVHDHTSIVLITTQSDSLLNKGLLNLPGTILFNIFVPNKVHCQIKSLLLQHRQLNSQLRAHLPLVTHSLDTLEESGLDTKLQNSCYRSAYGSRT